MFTPFAKWSTRRQWIIILSTLTLLLIAAEAAFTWYVFSQGRQDSLERSSDIARTAAAKLELILADNRIILEKIANLPTVRQFETQDCDPIFKTLTEFRAGQFERINLVATDGRLICEPNAKTAGREEATRSHVWFIAAMSATGHTVGNPFRSFPSQAWIIPLTYPVRNDQGQTIGAVVLSLDLKTLNQRIFAGTENIQGLRASVVDSDGRFVLHTDDSLIGQTPDISMQKIENISANTFRVLGLDQTWRLVGSAPVSGAKWIAFAGTPEDIALADVRRSVSIAAAIGILLLALFAIPAIWFGRFSVKRDEKSQQQVDELTGLQAFLWANIPEGAAFFNEQGIILDANEQLAAMLKRPRLEIIGQKLNAYSIDRNDEAREQLRKRGYSHWTTTFQRPDGTNIDIETKLQRFAAGTRQFFIGVFRDFTELKRAEAELRKSQELLEQTGLVAGIGGWEIDLATMTPRWTRQTKRLHEVSDDYQPTLDGAINFFPPEARPIIARAVEAAIQRGISYNLELPFITAKGRSIWVRAQGLPIVEEGKVARLVGTFQDISAQRLTAQQLEEARTNAEVASRAKSSFIAIMSHEIRTPLTGILGMADLLLNEKLAPAQRSLAERLSRSGHILLDLINDVLDFSKIEANKLAIDRVPFAPADIFQSVQELLEPLAIERGLTLAFNVAADLTTPLLGDPKRLRQVLVNLIGNALKFTEQGRVAVSAGRETDADGQPVLRIIVADTGIGISSADQANLFRPYSQGGHGSTRIGGTGLGLSISKLLVEAMGGDIAVSSTIGQGSTFSFTIKLQHDRTSALAVPDAGQRSLIAPKLALRILVAEDNETTRFLVDTMLTRKGHRVETVVNGAEAVAATQAKEYDVILMDMQMPVMDGITAVRRIRAQESKNKGIPIIALTADLVDENRSMYLEAGVNNIVGKPVDWAALDAELENQMRQARPNAVTNLDAVRPGNDNARVDDTPLPALTLDHEVLDGMRDLLGREKFAPLMVIFRQNLIEYSDLLRTALRQDDFKEARRTAHTLKGLSLQFGAQDVGELASYIETKAEDIGAIWKIMPRFDRAIAEALDALDRMDKSA